MADKFVDVYDQGDPEKDEVVQDTSTGFVDVYDKGNPEPAASAPPIEDTMSAANVARQTLGQGTAMGFGDEIEGLVRGVYDAAVNGANLGDAINNGIDYARKQNKDFETQNPKSALAMQVGGGVATGALGAGRALAAKGLSLGAKMARGSGAGGAIGGITGAGMAEGGVGDRAIGAGMGAVLGATGGAVLPVAGAGLKKVGSAINRFIPGGSTRQTEGLLRNTASEANVTPNSMINDLRTIGPQSVVADVGDKNFRDLARYSANKMGGKSAQDMLRKRHIDQGPRIERAIDKNIKDQPLDEYLKETAKVRSKQANKDYGKLRESKVELTPQLKSFFENKEIIKAYKKATSIADARQEIIVPLSRKTDEGTAYIKPNMKTLDYIKQALDDKVTKAYKRGDNEYANAMRELRDKFRGHIDEIVPEYKQVRSVYAGHSAALDAADAGSDFIMSNKMVNVNILKEMGEHEKEAFLVGVSDALKFKVLSPQDAADVTKKIFGSHLDRRRLKAAFGGDDVAYKKFEQVIKNEIKMAETYSVVNEGSRTAPMLMDERTFGRLSTLVGDGLGASAGSPNAIGALATRLADKLQSPPEVVAKKLSSLLLSQKPEDKIRAARILAKGGETNTNKLSRLLRAPTAATAGYSGGRMQRN
tara:strand:- start:53 stop:1993 length:1941 start_codon:yes stop_codon:yes gene_type:complete